MILDERTAGFRPLAPASLLATATTWSGALNTSRYDADGQRVLKIAGSETSRTYVVNELSEFSTEGGPIRWTVDYVSAGSRLLAAVRPAAGTFYPLTVAKSGAGAGRVTADPAGVDCGPDCTARYLSGTIVTLTATATDAYSSFTGWGGSCSGTASTATVTVDAAKSCTATFTRVTYTLTVQKTGDGADDSWVTSTPSGIDCGTSCAAPFGGGGTVQLTAYPADGYEFLYLGRNRVHDGHGQHDRGADLHGGVPGAATDLRSRRMPAGGVSGLGRGLVGRRIMQLPVPTGRTRWC